MNTLLWDKKNTVHCLQTIYHIIHTIHLVDVKEMIILISSLQDMIRSMEEHTASQFLKNSRQLPLMKLSGNPLPKDDNIKYLCKTETYCTDGCK